MPSYQSLFLKKVLPPILVMLLATGYSFAQRFEIRDGQFMLNGKPMRIYGGEMHYARIPREYWQQRIQMAKAMGCNALSIYVFWNYQETAPGVWNWTIDNHNLRAFVETAKAEGMYIILRPGPYVCAEWDFGGFPYWMVNMKLRSDDPAFLDSCHTYLREVYKQVDGLFIEQGGNIIMTQVENEYGSFSFDMQFKLSHHNRKKYLEDLANIFREVGFTHTLFTCDGGIIPVINFARLGHIKSIFPGTNDSKFLKTARHTVHKFYSKKGPYYIPEEYAGWFTHWGDAHMFHRDVEQYKTHIEALLKTDFSFSYYMVHGGTNFGFMNGANHNPGHEVQPVVTSYDYGAPIDEAGNRTPLYDSLRAVYERVTHTTLPPVPAPVASMAIDKIPIGPSFPTFGVTPGFDTISSHEPLTFEQAHLAFGYLIYEKVFNEAQNSKLSTIGITDYALIYINDSLVATIDRNGPVSNVPKTIALNIPNHGKLDILVENMGRVNFGKKLWDDSRGATKGIIMNGKPVQDLMIYKISPSQPFQLNFKGDISAEYLLSSKSQKLDYYPLQPFPNFYYKNFIADNLFYRPNQPILYTGYFNIYKTDDTYLDMRGFGKGVVFVNGHNVGRYWEIGPQYSLYVPGAWLHGGTNSIVIFDELNHSQQHYINATAKPVNR
jgi:beta-galactosidase